MNTVSTTHKAASVICNRRDFVRSTTVAGLVAGCNTLQAVEAGPETTPRVCIYTEQFQSLPIAKVCEVFQHIGVDGLDLTVRPGGHIEPKNARAELPAAVKAARDHGLDIMMLTTGINAPNKTAEGVLAACQDSGIDRIKLGYFGVPSQSFGKLAKLMDEVRRKLVAVAELAAKYEVKPCIHIHSGDTMPSNGFMVYDLIRDMPTDRIGAYLDSHHMTVTGGAGGWRQAIDLLTPWISLVALKNSQWRPVERDNTGQQRWRIEYCRLEDGIAPIADFVSTVEKVGYRGFYTLHTEYKRPVEDCIQLTTDDFRFLQKVFARLS
ncbi:MAG: TIM barrel protein [Pirellulales bacterium]